VTVKTEREHDFCPRARRFTFYFVVVLLVLIVVVVVVVVVRID
jgi:hypothetical protein